MRISRRLSLFISLSEIEELDLGGSGIRADSLPSRGITRTLRRAPTSSRFLIPMRILHPVLRLLRLNKTAPVVSKDCEGSRCVSIDFDRVLYNTSLSHPPTGELRISRFVSKPMIFQLYFASVRIECINICPVHFYLSSRSDDVNLPLFLSFSLSIDVVQA